MQTWSSGRALAAEFVGTGILTFVGVGITVLGSITGKPASLVVHAIAPALVILALIYALGEVSGAHFNPAVTVAFAIRGDFSWRRVLGYLIAQAAGSLLATALALALLVASPQALDESLVGTLPQRFWIELLLATFLILVILATANRARVVGHNAAIAVAGAIAFDGLFGFPISGAAMNPARTFGPIVFLHAWQSIPAYWLAPFVGGLIAVGLMWFFYGAPTPKEEDAAQP